LLWGQALVLTEEILEHNLMISQNEQFPLGLVNTKDKDKSQGTVWDYVMWALKRQDATKTMGS